MPRTIYLYNTASRKKEKFEPVHDPVGMYCCGPTVYNFAHIGNLRTYIFEDVLKRVLLSAGYKVKHVINITDVGHLTSDADTGEDKMEKGAQREGKTVWDIAEFFTSRFMENLRDLNIIQPDIWPKATDHISQMIDIVKELEKNGFTYRTSDGIYFDTSRFDSYCKFARLNPDSLRAGERVEMGEKRSATDFALWKFSPTDKKRQMEWQSPWGIGFPGWHIECSAMAQKYLSLPIDIHCGGSDHIRVHHTNEIAQSEAATGKQFVRYWLHGEFLVLDKGKMAKSDGNFITLDSIKEANIPQLAYRLFCFTAHYRTPLTFSWEGLQASVQSLQNLRSMVPDVDNCGQIDNGITDKLLHPFYMAVYDDLNMPRAVAALWDLLRDRAIDPVVKRACVSCADEILGLDLLLEQRKLSEELIESDGVKIKLISESRLSDTDRINIVEKIRVRKTARKSRDFTTADRIRDELGGLGITIKDLPDGTTECTIPASVPG